MGTYYHEAGGKENSGKRDLQITTLDPHDFDQPGLQNNTSPELRSHLRQVGKDPESVQNYALKLSGGDEATHNRFVVPDWGALRFNVHVPTPSAPTDQDSYVQIFLITEQGERVELHSPDLPETEPYLDPEVDPQEANNPNLPAVDLREVSRFALDAQTMQSQLNRIAFGGYGFETFQVDVPNRLRGKSATLEISVHGNTPKH